MNYRLPTVVLVFSAMLMGIVISRAYADTTITWTPSSLIEAVGVGQSRPIAASFTSSSDLTNTTVSVVPELQPYIQVTPSILSGTLYRGTKTTLTVTFSVAPNATIGTYRGTIHLKSGKQTIAKPLPVTIQVVAGTPTLKDKILALERGGEIPVLDRSPSIMGLDTNSNGIRDDIDNYISTLPLTPDQKKSIEQLARALQATLLVDITNVTAITQVRANAHRAIDCLDTQMPVLKDRDWLLTRIEAITANTKDRTKQYILYNNALSGSVSPSLPSGNVCEN